MKNILITGGNGYIGARLCEYLADTGYSVTALCYPEIPVDERWTSKLQAIKGDVKDEFFLKELAEDNQFDTIIHLVSLDHHDSNKGLPKEVSEVNIIPTWSLLNIFSNKGLKQFLYLSTVHVYGSLKDKIILESDPTLPAAPYALTHLLSERICEYYQLNSEVECIAVRLSNSYGAPLFINNNCWWLVINDLCRMAYEKKEIVLSSDGSPQRDFIHGWDVCKAIKCILEKKNQDYTTYNISSGHTLTIEQIAFKIQQIYNLRYNLNIPVKMQPKKADNGQKCYIIDNSRLLQTGYTPDWPIERGINDLFDYLERCM